MPVPEVTDSPNVCAISDDAASLYPDVFSACAVTRAQLARTDQVALADSLMGQTLTNGVLSSESETKVKENSSQNTDLKISESVLGKSNSLDFPITRSQIIAAQKEDPS